MSGFRGLMTIALITVLAGCGDSDTLAKVAGHKLSVGEGVELLAAQPQLPNEPEVADALANIWVDYILLAHTALQDSTFGSLNFDAVMRPEIEQELVFRLRQDVIQVDTVIEESELRALYEERMPGAEVRARHILLSSDPGAAPAQRDSVMALANELRARLAAGESFETLASEYSGDPGSARQGGDLGFFERGQMVEPFENAAFSLQPGEVSEPVESMFGVHIIRVEERRVPAFDEVRQRFLAELRNERVNDAELQYLESIEGPADIRITDDAYTLVRDVAGQPAASLSRRAGSRAIVEYSDTALSVADFQEFLRSRPAGFAAQVMDAPDEQLEGLLRSLVRGELLVAQARQRGLDLTDEEKAELREGARTEFKAATQRAGLHEITIEDGESRKEAIDRIVMEKIRAIVAGQGEVIPLGPLSFPLRKEHNAVVNERGVAKVVERIQASRPEDGGLFPDFPQPAPIEPGDPAGQDAAPPQEEGPQ